MKKTIFQALALACLMTTAVSAKTIYCNNPNIYFSPYVWKSVTTHNTPSMEATTPGAYFKTVVTKTDSIGVVIDATASKDTPSYQMPHIEYSVDGKPFVQKELETRYEIYTLTLAEGLDASKDHTVIFYFRAANLVADRWGSSRGHLIVKGISVSDSGIAKAPSIRPKRVIGFGDSITEGVGVDEQFTTWDILKVNNSRGSWLALTCEAVDAEYGQIGSGGQGMMQEAMPVPPVPRAWDKYDASASRLVNGKLSPQPDYIICGMGTNDFKMETHDYSAVDFVTPYTKWLKDIRKAAPNAYIFCVVPPAGVHRDNLTGLVASLNKSGDKKIYIVDTPNLNDRITTEPYPTSLTYDGVHPSQYGQALIAATVAFKIGEIISD